MTLETIYKTYVSFCDRAGVPASSFETWYTNSEHLDDKLSKLLKDNKEIKVVSPVIFDPADGS